jgi:hypothetical protein
MSVRFCPKHAKPYANGALILSWMKGKVFSAKGLDLAVSNLAASSRRPLHWAPTREQVFSGRPGHASDGKGMFSKDDTNLSPRDHAARRAAGSASGKSTPAPSTDYRKLAEDLKGRTHSGTERLARLYVTEPGTSKILWPETYEARLRMSRS